MIKSITCTRLFINDLDLKQQELSALFQGELNIILTKTGGTNSHFSLR